MVEDPAGEDQATAEREWFFEVERLIESFRETRRLFQTSRVLILSVWLNGTHLSVTIDSVPWAAAPPTSGATREGSSRHGIPVTPRDGQALPLAFHQSVCSRLE
jgi:hypothetical protein